MPITTNEVQVLWSASASQSVTASSNATSDAFSINQTCFQASIELKADNESTPGAGDTVTFYLLATLGDPDGATTDEYGTTTQDIPLGTLDTNADDPAIRTVHLGMPLKGGKIYAVNNASSNAITVSACILEQRG